MMILTVGLWMAPTVAVTGSTEVRTAKKEGNMQSQDKRTGKPVISETPPKPHDTGDKSNDPVEWPAHLPNGGHGSGDGKHDVQLPEEIHGTGDGKHGYG